MTTYISILRGINVSGQKIIKMYALKNMYEKLNFENVQTYVQSGNAIFSAKEKDTKVLEKVISLQIEKEFGFNVPVIVLNTKTLEKIIEKKHSSEEIAFLPNAVYLNCPNGYGKTKLNNNFLENKLKVQATTRNWKTTNELLKLATK